jgi:hypothetical protein
VRCGLVSEVRYCAPPDVARGFPRRSWVHAHDAIHLLSLRDALREDEDDGSPLDRMIHMLTIERIAPRRSDPNA